MDLTRALQSVPDTPSGTDEDDGRDWGTIAFRVLLVLLLTAGVGVFAFSRDAANTQTDLGTLLRLIETKCADGDPGGELGTLCRQTEQVRNDNAAAVAAAAGLNTDQVIALVNAQLDARGTTTGAQSVDRAVVVDVVRQVLAANPELYRGTPGEAGQPGAGPTDDQVLAAAAAVIAADPQRFRGEKGEPGQSPPCLAQPGQCQGRGVASAQVVDCRWQVTYTDGVTTDAGAACAPSGDGSGPTTAPNPPADPADPTDPAPTAGPAPPPDPGSPTPTTDPAPPPDDSLFG